MPTFSQLRRIWLEVDHRGRVAADDHDGEDGRADRVRAAIGRDVLADRLRGSPRRSARPGAVGAARRRTRSVPSSSAGSGSRASPLRTASRVGRGRSSRRRRAVSSPGPWPRRRTPRRRPTGRLTRTFAAAPRAAASPSSAATFEVARRVDVAAADERLGRATSSRHASTVTQRHLRARPRRGRAAPPARRLLLVGLAGQLHRRARTPRTRRRPRRPGRGTASRGAGRARPPARGGAAWAAYFGRPWDSDATIATSAAPRDAATAEALPPPGTGSADASTVDEPAEGQVAEPRTRARRLAPGDCRLRSGANPAALRNASTAAAGVGNGAGAVPARPPRHPTAASGRRSPGNVRSGGATLVVEGRDRPAPRAMLVRERESGPGGLDLEQRPRAGDDRIRRGLFANRGEPRDRESLVPQVISRGLPSNQPVRTWTSTGSTLIIAMLWLLPAGQLGIVRRGGTPATERLFCSTSS